MATSGSTSMYIRHLAAAVVIIAAASAAVICVAVPIASKAQERVTPLVEAPSYVTSAKLRERALAALGKKLGGELPPISKLEITKDRITVWTQGKAAAYHTDEWVISRFKLLALDSDTIAGPQPTQGDGIVARQEGSFFDFKDAAFDRLDAMIGAATGMAQLEDRASVASITLSRTIGILPEPHYGEPRWTIQLATPRESATVYAGLDGTIIGADLANTFRAERLNLLADDEWPADEAQADLAAAIGDRQITELRIYDTYLYAEALISAEQLRDYSWKLGGVSAGLTVPYFSFGDTAPFALSELDLTRLPEVKRKALGAFDSPGATITYMSAEKPTDRPSAPEVLWRVDLRQADGAEGKVLLDAGAEVVEVTLPESRRAQLATAPWLSPEGVAQTLARLEQQFGKDAWFGEIMLQDDSGTVLVEDPQAPGQMANFIVDAQSITRFGSVMPWDAELDETRAFHISDLATLDAPRLDDLGKRTVERMAISNIAPWRYTISRKLLLLEPNDSRLMLEIRAGRDDGNVGGWVTWQLDGSEADVMLP